MAGKIDKDKLYTADEVKMMLNEAKVRKPKYVPKTKYNKQWLTESEMAIILKSKMSEKEKLTIYMIYYCALRVNELCKIKIGDINLIKGELTIWSAKKTTEPANVPIKAKVVDMLKPIIKNKQPEEYLIRGYFENKPMDTSSVFYMVNRVVSRCGINKKIGTHTFRRSRATHLLNMGVAIDDVKDLLRHKNIQTTTVYKKMATDKLKERIDKAEDI